MCKKSFTPEIMLIALILANSFGIVPALAEEITISQKNKLFMLNGKEIKTITVNEGDTINFMNDDPWFHNIYSLSEAKTFDLGSYPQGESRSVTFDKQGVMEIECAIHPDMHLEVIVK